jgi:hypothetical protein
MPITDRHRKEVLCPRGVSEEIANYVDLSSRPRYASFENKGDIREHHTHPKPWYSNLVKLSPGLVVNRWGIDGETLPSYLRFDEKLWTPRRTPAGHPGGPTLGFPHDHPRGGDLPDHHYHGGRYRYPSTKDVGALSKVIDLHPFSRALLLENPAAPFHLCLEGSLNADAILSGGENAPPAIAGSVSSVTMWELAAVQLARWLPQLRAASFVFLIPDSDYNTRGMLKNGHPDWINENVRMQTDLAARWLRLRGVNVVKMIPPYLTSGQAQEAGISDEDRFKIGIGDHVALDGNHGRWNEYTNPRGVHLIAWAPPKERMRHLRAGITHHKTLEHLDRVEALLALLESTCGQTGKFMPGWAQRALRWRGKNGVQAALDTAQDEGLLTYWNGYHRINEETGEDYSTPSTFVFQLNDPQAAVNGYCSRCGTILNGHRRDGARCQRRRKRMARL